MPEFDDREGCVAQAMIRKVRYVPPAPGCGKFGCGDGMEG